MSSQLSTQYNHIHAIFALLIMSLRDVAARIGVPLHVLCGVVAHDFGRIFS